MSGSLPTHAPAKSQTNAYSRNPVGTLTTHAQNLLAAALSDNTKSAYKKNMGSLYTILSMYNFQSSITYSITQFHCKNVSLGYSPSSISSQANSISSHVSASHKLYTQDPQSAGSSRSFLSQESYTRRSPFCTL